MGPGPYSRNGLVSGTNIGTVGGSGSYTRTGVSTGLSIETGLGFGEITGTGWDLRSDSRQAAIMGDD